MSVAGLIVHEAEGAVDEVLEHIESAFAGRGIVPLLRVDHSAAASAMGIPLAPLALFLFGNPQVGSPLMAAHPSLGIDLPLKLLVWEEGCVKVGFNDPAWLVERHGGNASAASVEKMRTLLDALARQAAGDTV